MACGYFTYGQVPSTTSRPRSRAWSSSGFTAPWVRTTTVVPWPTSATRSTVPTPISRVRETNCGLWMMGPSVTTGACRSRATSMSWSTVRRTPQQKPAVLAILTCIKSSPAVYSPGAEPGKARLRARPGPPLHLGREPLHHVVEREPPGVDDDGVLGGAERSHVPGAVVPIALALVGEHRLERLGIALPLQLEEPAPGAHLVGRGEEELGVGVGEDHRADVAPLEDRAAVPGVGGEAPLQLEESGPDHRPRRDRARTERHGRRADGGRDVLAVEQHPLAGGLRAGRRGLEGDAQRGQEAAEPGVVVEADPGPARGERHRAVDGSGVHHGEAEARGEAARGRAL